MTIRKAVCLLVTCLSLTSLSAATLTNADVIKMTAANLDPDVIIATINNSDPSFDVSTDGLVALSSAKVPSKVVTAMIERANGGTHRSTQTAPSSAQSAGAVTSGAEHSPSTVVLIDGDHRTEMRYINPQMRTAARALGFGGVATYAVLRKR